MARYPGRLYFTKGEGRRVRSTVGDSDLAAAHPKATQDLTTRHSHFPRKDHVTTDNDDRPPYPPPGHWKHCSLHYVIEDAVLASVALLQAFNAPPREPCNQGDRCLLAHVESPNA